ncbi:MAG: glycine--tRNA ligase [Mycoplasmataceae bacterium]|nr:glycine--tRNA ligase [Mycoplasmataceae bacterium]
MRLKIPFGIAQIGKAFRNEIVARNFIFRTREFEQMEIEFFVNPKDSDFWFDSFESKYVNFLSLLGIKGKSFKVVDIAKDELAHYSDKTIDFLYEFPFGWEELLGIANRTNFDLKSHEKGSGQKMEYIDPHTRERYIPHVIEPSVGVERLMLAVFCESYEVEPLEDNDSRVVMNLPFEIAPYQIAVLPLTNKLDEKANEVVSDLLKDTNFRITYDKSGSIGKRYRRQDSIGTNFCITVDFQTLEDETVTIRDRDTMEQKRINVNDISNLLRK